MSPNGDFYCLITALNTLPYAELLKFKDRWYEDMAGLYKYTVNNDLNSAIFRMLKTIFAIMKEKQKKLELK